MDISNLDLLYNSAQQLVPEQRFAFDEVIKYCKNLKKGNCNTFQNAKTSITNNSWWCRIRQK